MQLGPPCICLSFGLDTFGSVFFGYGGGDGRVQTAGEEYAVGHVAHQLAAYGRFESIVQFLYIGGIVFDIVILHPVADVPAGEILIAAIEIMSRRKLVVCGRETFEPFQFG